MQLSRKHLALTALLSLSFAARAEDAAPAAASYDGGSEVGVLIGGAWQRPSFSTNGLSLSSVAYTGFAGGAYIQHAFAPIFSLEVSMMYVRRVFTPMLDLQHRTSTLEFPLLARVWLIPKYLTVGVGPYLAMGIGNMTVTNGLTSYQQSYAMAGYRSFEFGFAGSIQGRLPISANASALIDVRGLLGITNERINGSSFYSARYRELQVLAGIGTAF